MAPQLIIMNGPAYSAEEFRNLLFSTPLTEVYRCLLNNRGQFPEVMAEFYLWLETRVNAGTLNLAPDYNPSIVGNLLSHENFGLEPLLVKTLKTSSPFRNYLLQYFSWYSSGVSFKKAFEPYLDAVVETQIFRGLESFLADKKVPAALVNKTFQVVPEDVARHLRVNGRDTRFSEATMMLLVDSRNDWVLTELALNRKATPDVLRRLAQNGNEWVRRKVGLHANTPVDVLERLANDPLLTVRIGAAKNPNTPEPCLWQLAGSGSKQVMASLNKNNTWISIMKENKKRENS